jgi:hypothetical protein
VLSVPQVEGAEGLTVRVEQGISPSFSQAGGELPYTPTFGMGSLSSDNITPAEISDFNSFKGSYLASPIAQYRRSQLSGMITSPRAAKLQALRAIEGSPVDPVAVSPAATALAGPLIIPLVQAEDSFRARKVSPKKFLRPRRAARRTARRAAQRATRRATRKPKISGPMLNPKSNPKILQAHKVGL